MSYKAGQRCRGREERTRKASRNPDSSSISSSSAPVAMASTHLSVLLCALALILNIPADAQGDLAVDCCLMVGFKTIPKQVVLSYSNQIRGDGCNLDAVVFTTRKGRKLCAPTAREAGWVQDLIRFIETRLKKCKATKFQGKRCEGLKTTRHI